MILWMIDQAYNIYIRNLSAASRVSAKQLYTMSISKIHTP